MLRWMLIFIIAAAIAVLFGMIGMAAAAGPVSLSFYLVSALLALGCLETLIRGARSTARRH